MHKQFDYYVWCKYFPHSFVDLYLCLYYFLAQNLMLHFRKKLYFFWLRYTFSYLCFTLYTFKMNHALLISKLLLLNQHSQIFQCWVWSFSPKIAHYFLLLFKRIYLCFCIMCVYLQYMQLFFIHSFFLIILGKMYTT